MADILTQAQQDIYAASIKQGMRPDAARRLAELCSKTPPKRSTSWTPDKDQIRGGFLKAPRAAAPRSSDDLEDVCRMLGLQGFAARFRAARLSPHEIAATLRQFLPRDASAADRDRLGLQLLAREQGGPYAH